MMKRARGQLAFCIWFLLGISIVPKWVRQILHRRYPMSKSVSVGMTGLNGVQEQKLKAALRRMCPSEPWVEAQIKTTLKIDFRGKPQSCRHHDPAVFPPGGN